LDRALICGPGCGLFESGDPPRQIAEVDGVFHLALADKMLTIASEQSENGTLIGNTRQRPPFTVYHRNAKGRDRFGHKVHGVENFPVIPFRRPQQWFDQIGYLNSVISFIHSRQDL
jgi:hypothetical protein